MTLTPDYSAEYQQVCYLTLTVRVTSWGPLTLILPYQYQEATVDAEEIEEYEEEEEEEEIAE